jgi:hypothetical protein
MVRCRNITHSDVVWQEVCVWMNISGVKIFDDSHLCCFREAALSNGKPSAFLKGEIMHEVLWFGDASLGLVAGFPFLLFSRKVRDFYLWVFHLGLGFNAFVVQCSIVNWGLKSSFAVEVWQFYFFWLAIFPLAPGGTGWVGVAVFLSNSEFIKIFFVVTDCKIWLREHRLRLLPWNGCWLHEVENVLLIFNFLVSFWFYYITSFALLLDSELEVFNFKVAKNVWKGVGLNIIRISMCLFYLQVNSLIKSCVIRFFSFFCLFRRVKPFLRTYFF